MGCDGTSTEALEASIVEEIPAYPTIADPSGVDL